MTTTNPTPTQQGETLEPVLLDRNDVLDTVALFCSHFETLGERFKKQLRNTIRAIPPRRAAVAGPRGDALLSDDDAALLAHAITIAREVQEFIWADCYPSLRPYDAEGWRRLFQKRVDCIAETDLTKHGGLATLRKRLLQQAALSIKALALVNRWVKQNPPQLSQGSDGADLAAAASSPTPAEQPVDMILFCPRCGTQHVDAEEDETNFRHRMDAFSLGAEWQDRVPSRWTNPPHRSHLCHQCGAIWRPADVPTNGVAAITTRGKEDNIYLVAAPPESTRVEGEQADRTCPACSVGRLNFHCGDYGTGVFAPDGYQETVWEEFFQCNRCQETFDPNDIKGQTEIDQ